MKQLCLQQVLSAKVVTNARSPGSKCYGLVTMSSSSEVARSIDHLDLTELHGQQIYVERVSKLSCCYGFFKAVTSGCPTISSPSPPQFCFVNSVTDKLARIVLGLAHSAINKMLFVKYSNKGTV